MQSSSASQCCVLEQALSSVELKQFPARQRSRVHDTPSAQSESLRQPTQPNRGSHFSPSAQFDGCASKRQRWATQLSIVQATPSEQSASPRHCRQPSSRSQKPSLQVESTAACVQAPCSQRSLEQATPSSQSRSP